MKRTATVLLCAAACTMPTPAWADGGTTVVCGQVITKSIKVANDLRDCPGIGLEVGARKITIDLNGHTIDGAAGNPNPGIDNSPIFGTRPGFAEVKIKDGTVTGFHEGILLGTGADSNSIERILGINNNDDGIHVNGVDRLRISDFNGFQNGDNGIDLFSVTKSRVERSVALNNAFTGIVLAGTSTRNELRRNKAVNNNRNGIVIDSTVAATRIDDNDVNINSTNGLIVNSTDAATVIKDNRANNNTPGFGIIAAAGVTDGGGNRASGNTAGQCSPNIRCTP